MTRCVVAGRRSLLCPHGGSMRVWSRTASTSRRTRTGRDREAAPRAADRFHRDGRDLDDPGGDVPENAASIRLHEESGFVTVGRRTGLAKLDGSLAGRRPHGKTQPARRLACPLFRDAERPTSAVLALRRPCICKAEARADAGLLTPTQPRGQALSRLRGEGLRRRCGICLISHDRMRVVRRSSTKGTSAKWTSRSSPTERS